MEIKKIFKGFLNLFDLRKSFTLFIAGIVLILLAGFLEWVL